MKKFLPTVYMIICCFALISCDETATNNPNSPSKPTTPTGIKTEDGGDKNKKNQQPQVATVKDIANGDLLCYVTLVNEEGKENQVGASFDICAEEQKFINQKVRATYTIESINDCSSAEPCGKTRKESIITKMEVLSR